MSLLKILSMPFFSFAAFALSCSNNNANSESNLTSLELTQKPENTVPSNTTSNSTNTTTLITVDCAGLLTISNIEDICGNVGIVERISSIERKGKNCNRLYGVGKNAWGDELVFITTVLNDATSATVSFNKTKKDNANNGLVSINNLGEEAFSLNFKDPLNKRETHQIIFRKNNFLIELKTNESRSVKTPCPCYEMEKLKKLAAKVSTNIL